MRIDVPRLHPGGMQHLAGLCLICGHWGGHYNPTFQIGGSPLHEQPFPLTQPLVLTQPLLATPSLPRAQSPTPLAISPSSDQQQSFVQALTDLARLHNTGGLDADEFRMAKRKLLQLYVFLVVHILIKSLVHVSFDQWRV